MMIQDLLEHANFWVLAALAAAFLFFLTRRRSPSRDGSVSTRSDKNDR